MTNMLVEVGHSGPHLQPQHLGHRGRQLVICEFEAGLLYIVSFTEFQERQTKNILTEAKMEAGNLTYRFLAGVAD